MNFNATSLGAVVNVTTGNQPVDLATLFNIPSLRVSSASDVLIDNRGNFDAYILFGGSDAVAAATTCVRVPAGSMTTYGKGNALFMAVIGDGATTLVLHLGQGS